MSNSKLYSNSVFLRTSAVYGSGQSTKFSQPSHTEKLSHGLRQENLSTTRAAGRTLPPDSNSSNTKRTRSPGPDSSAAAAAPAAAPGTPRSGPTVTRSAADGTRPSTPTKEKAGSRPSTPTRDRAAAGNSPMRTSSSNNINNNNNSRPAGSPSKRNTDVDSGVDNTRRARGYDAAANERLFGGRTVQELISGQFTEGGAGSRTNSPTEKFVRRPVAAPQRKEPDQLWTRTRGAEKIVLMGHRAPGALKEQVGMHSSVHIGDGTLEPPVENKLEKTGKKIVEGPCKEDNLVTAGCQIRQEGGSSAPRSTTPRRAKGTGATSDFHNANFNSKFSFLVPPYLADKTLLSACPAGLLNEFQSAPATCTEPFGLGYRHRRHYDPVDSVRNDLLQFDIDPSSTNSNRNSPVKPRGKAHVEGKGANYSHNVLNLAEQVKNNNPYVLTDGTDDTPRRKRHLVGPPAFVPEPMRNIRNRSASPNASPLFTKGEVRRDNLLSHRDNNAEARQSSLGYGAGLNSTMRSEYGRHTTPPRGVARGGSPIRSSSQRAQSPTLQSSIGFGTSAAVAAAATDRSNTPRKTGLARAEYSLPKDSPRPF